MEKVTVNFHAFGLMRVKISTQNNSENSNKADLKCFVPLAVMQTQK